MTDRPAPPTNAQVSSDERRVGAMPSAVAGSSAGRAAGSGAPILAIETSTTVARVAVVDGRSGLTLAMAEAVSDRHSSNLLRLCIETTERARVAVAGLGAIACGAGPGSFTGLRVGFAVAKGLALPTDLPLVLVSSLEALALDMLQVAEGGDVLLLPCLDAGKGQVYAALFQAGEGGAVRLISDEWAIEPAVLSEQMSGRDGSSVIACAGPGVTRYWDVLEKGLGGRGLRMDVAGPSAEAVARRALLKLARGETADLGTAAPAYGRAPDITQPRRPAG